MMEITYSADCIEFEKELNGLDSFVLEFTEILDKHNIQYVIVSGYVAILFGRNRTSEDIDIIIQKLDIASFTKLWNDLSSHFDCINATGVPSAYAEYLNKSAAIRFSRHGAFIPNIEVKFPQTELDQLTIAARKKVALNKRMLFISPFEIQIPFKLYLGSEKDIEDARFLYLLFKEHIEISTLMEFLRKLKIVERFDRYLS